MEMIDEDVFPDDVVCKVFLLSTVVADVDGIAGNGGQWSLTDPHGEE